VKGGTDKGRGGRVVKGWPWDSGSHNNKVVTVLYWKGGYEALP